MKIAITGGTGFVGRSIARELLGAGHEVVLIARGLDQTCPSIRQQPGVRFIAAGLNDTDKLASALAGCDAVAHCAGINRELGAQTYPNVHIDGTRHLVEAARRAGVRKIAMISFLRARPHGGAAYHASKWAAEEIVRGSGLNYTIFKCGVIYGKGDHMLDRLSHAFHTFPLFAFVGFKDKPIRPLAVEDIARLVKASLANGALSGRTAAAMGPETLTLRGAVRRVARVTGRHPLMFPMPVWFHFALGWLAEKVMATPLVSVSQVRMLSEGLAESNPPCEELAPDLAPSIPFSEEQIRQGLPAPGSFTWRDLRWFRASAKSAHHSRAFFQLP
ncbi:MAG TPA: NAD(P)H-binding protein [Verrucomicrobiae bacterium]|jgi:NADH dehydrogenase